MNLLEQLKEYCGEDYYPFHMPGHKRSFEGKENGLPYGLDITEITGFDNFHAPEKGEVLWNVYDKAKRLYQTLASYPLINGSTSGIMAAISSVAGLHDEIILARNCHRSVYRTCELLGLQTHYLCPDYHEKYGIFTDIDLERLEECLNNYPESRAVVVTSPNYEGVILDIHNIAQVVHRHHMLLIVDEAHGAHLPFAMPDKSAVYAGADIVIQSLHKTLPSLTQTAILHVCKGAGDREGFHPDKVAEYVSLYQSTSPSYILMASMEECIDACMKWKEDEAFDKFYGYLEEERRRYASLSHFRLLNGSDLGAYAYDNSRFVIAVEEGMMSSEELFARLRDEYHIECEMQTLKYVTAITTICDREEGFVRLREAMFEMDKMPEENMRTLSNIKCAKVDKNVHNYHKNVHKNRLCCIPEAVMSLREAMEQPVAEVSFEKLKFQIEEDYVKESSIPLWQVYKRPVSAGYVMIYPPGIPVIAPGEEYNKEVVETISQALEQNLKILGMENGCVKLLA